MQGLGVFLGCLVLGVTAIAAIGSIAASVTAAIKDDARDLLGGDAEARLAYRPADPKEREFLEEAGSVSEVATMRAMARTEDGVRRSLIELKAVDAAYPLYGAVDLSPAQSLDAALGARDGNYGAAVDSAILGRLGLSIGDRMKIGESVLQIRATIVREPDAATGGLIFGPRVLTSAQALGETELIRPGALVTYHYRLRLRPGVDAAAWGNSARAAFPEAGWQIRSFGEASPSLQRLIDRVGLFLSLVGLTALLVGGVGIGNAIGNYIAGKTTTIATLKCLGASNRLVFTAYLLEVLVLALLGIAVALLLGTLAPVAVSPLLAGVLPVSVRFAIHPVPLALAALFGLLTTLAFSLWPLAGIGRVSAGALFRDSVDRARRRVPTRSDGGAGARARGPRRLYRARPKSGVMVRRRGDRHLCTVSRGGSGDPLGREAARPAPPTGTAPRARKFAPSGSPDRANRARFGYRADRADRRCACGGQSLP